MNPHYRLSFSLLTFYAYDVSVAAFTIKGSGVASENGTVTGEAGMLISLSAY